MTNSDLLYDKISRFEWLLRRMQINGTTRFDPSRGQGKVLATLKKQDGISTKDLSYVLGITVTALNESLNRLEKAGLIEKRPNEHDKRVMLVYLTDEGRKETETGEAYNSINYLDCLTLDEQKNFENYLDRLIVSLETNLEEKSNKFAKHVKTVTEGRKKILGNGFYSSFHSTFDFPGFPGTLDSYVEMKLADEGDNEDLSF